jgi:hypothetical protein
MSARLVQSTPPLRPDRDKRRSQAFGDLESPIHDLRKMASIAAELLASSSDSREIELAEFAVYQTQKMADDLVAKYNSYYEG